jgi:hypothetical protein
MLSKVGLSGLPLRVAQAQETTSPALSPPSEGARSASKRAYTSHLALLPLRLQAIRDN